MRRRGRWRSGAETAGDHSSGGPAGRGLAHHRVAVSAGQGQPETEDQDQGRIRDQDAGLSPEPGRPVDADPADESAGDRARRRIPLPGPDCSRRPSRPRTGPGIRSRWSASRAARGRASARIDELAESGQVEGILAISLDRSQGQPVPRGCRSSESEIYDEKLRGLGELADAAEVREIIEYLGSLGHRTFFHVAGAPDLRVGPQPQERLPRDDRGARAGVRSAWSTATGRPSPASTRSPACRTTAA